MSPQVALAGSMARLNEWVFNRALRHYQWVVSQRARMEVCSPLTGASLVHTRCVLARAGLQAGYLFEASGEEALLLFPAEIGRAHELKWACSPASGRVWVLGTLPHEPSVREAALADLTEPMRQIVAGLRQGEAIRAVDAPLPVVLAGHNNFAHLAWNHLPALEALAALVPGLPVVMTGRPLGPLSGLLEGWTDAQVWGISKLFRPGEVLVELSWVTPVGSSQMGLNFLAGLKARLAPQLSPASRVLMDRLAVVPGPVFWFSLRKRQRNCQNGLEFLGQLCRRVLAEYPEACVVFDGFALPVSAGGDAAGVPDFSAHVDEVQQQFDALLAADPALALAANAGQVVLLNGVSLADAILVAGMASFYVCHGGTQQHKIAWFHAVPGVIHVPDPSKGLERWYGDQSAVALEPVCLPPPFIALEPTADAQVKARNRDYRIQDVAGAVAWTLDRMRASGLPAAAPNP